MDALVINSIKQKETRCWSEPIQMSYERTTDTSSPTSHLQWSVKGTQRPTINERVATRIDSLFKWCLVKAPLPQQLAIKCQGAPLRANPSTVQAHRPNFRANSIKKHWWSLLFARCKQKRATIWTKSKQWEHIDRPSQRANHSRHSSWKNQKSLKRKS